MPSVCGRNRLRFGRLLHLKSTGLFNPFLLCSCDFCWICSESNTGIFPIVCISEWHGCVIENGFMIVQVEPRLSSFGDSSKNYFTDSFFKLGNASIPNDVMYDGNVDVELRQIFQDIVESSVSIYTISSFSKQFYWTSIRLGGKLVSIRYQHKWHHNYYM